MAVVEAPTHVCHILDTHFCGDEAVIGHDCADVPFWDTLPCTDIEAGGVGCLAHDLTLSTPVLANLPGSACDPTSLILGAPLVIELPLVPARDEAPEA